MKDINFEGRCPLSVSENLKIKADSYDLHFDETIIRYGILILSFSLNYYYRKYKPGI